MPGRMEIFHIGILSWVTWLPAVGALLLLFFNRDKKNGIRGFANMWIVLCFLISIPLVTGLFKSGNGYDRAYGGLQFIEDHDWIPLIGARYQMGIDGLSLVLVMLTTLLGVISVVCSWAYIREKGREKEYYIMMLLLQSGMLGAFVSAEFPNPKLRDQQVRSIALSNPADPRGGVNSEMLNLALDAMKRADGTDPQTNRSLP